eukprot:tig00000402_g183.t1
MAWVVSFLSSYSTFIAELRAETTQHEGAGAANLASPLEKLLEELDEISRSIGETRSGEAERLHGIMARLAMFDGKSMMVPDLEKATRDPETRDWLLREVRPVEKLGYKRRLRN